MTQTVLRIDASARHQGSVSRELAARVVDRIANADVVTRDLANSPVPQVDEDWVNANFTPEDARTPAQAAKLALSNELVAEVQAADTLVIGVPVYNFSIPAALKAWIDHIARAGVTFKYSEQGPVGLLEGKRAVLVVAAGGTEVGSDYDFATGYMRHILGFIGITDVEIVAADKLMIDADATMKSAGEQVDALSLAA